QTYAARGNGLSYGWSGDNTTQSRDRNSASSPDQRYDTLVEFNGKTWELAVPNGIYLVHMVAGDPRYYDSNYMISAEGVVVASGMPSTNHRWIEGSSVVSVTDGRLPVTGAAGSRHSKLDLLAFAPYAATGAD